MGKKVLAGSPEAEAQKQIKENERRIEAARLLTSTLKTALSGSEDAKQEFFKRMGELTNTEFSDWLSVTKNDMKAKEDRAVGKFMDEDFNKRLMKELL